MAFAETFKALSDPVRERIAQLLKNGKMSAGEIGGHFDMTGATISYHLKILKKADLVWETKVKNFVYYELNTTVVEELLSSEFSDDRIWLHLSCQNVLRSLRLTFSRFSEAAGFLSAQGPKVP